jgi:hypothetical protein
VLGARARGGATREAGGVADTFGEGGAGEIQQRWAQNLELLWLKRMKA